MRSVLPQPPRTKHSLAGSYDNKREDEWKTRESSEKRYAGVKPA